MKIEVVFNFTLFRDKESKNTFSLGANHLHKKYVLNNKKGLISKMIYIDKNTFNSFFLCESIEVISNYKQAIIINQ